MRNKFETEVKNSVFQLWEFLLSYGAAEAILIITNFNLRYDNGKINKTSITTFFVLANDCNYKEMGNGLKCFLFRFNWRCLPADIVEFSHETDNREGEVKGSW